MQAIANKFFSKLGWSNPTKTCRICLAEDEPQNIISTYCGHEYHKPCLEEWIDTSETCPECRQKCEPKMLEVPMGTFLKDSYTFLQEEAKNENLLQNALVKETFQTDRFRFFENIKILKDKSREKQRTFFTLNKEVKICRTKDNIKGEVLDGSYFLDSIWWERFIYLSEIEELAKENKKLREEFYSEKLAHKECKALLVASNIEKKTLFIELTKKNFETEKYKIIQSFQNKLESSLEEKIAEFKAEKEFSDMIYNIMICVSSVFVFIFGFLLLRKSGGEDVKLSHNA